MILSCQNINKSFGMKEILKNISFHIEEREKMAIVGMNGAGKSTLLKIIMKEMEKDSGEVIISKGKTLGYLSQHQDLHTEFTIFDELINVKKEILDLEKKIRNTEQDMKLAEGKELENLLEQYSKYSHDFELKDGYAYKSEVVGVLKGLGFLEEDFEKNINTLSGGQKTRVSLGKLLLTKPDIILLDEPTNHLDLSSVAWLETFLLNYNGTVILVSHDRYFLDRIVTKIVEIDHGSGTTFTGNYSQYAQKKEQLNEAKLKEYLNQQQVIKHQEEVITKLKSFNREKSIKRAQSREKALDKIERVEKPVIHTEKMKLNLEPSILSGNDVLTVEDISMKFDGDPLFEKLSFQIHRGEKVALIGKNGTGKTTILKIIRNLLTPGAGQVRLGSKVEIGYFDQEHQVLQEDKSIFQEISDSYPNLTGTRIRNILAAFLFTNDDVFKIIGTLSGGERSRVSLAKLMLSNSNFLLLDEPTNHMDIASKEILESAISQYSGTIFFVSHDRYFINKTATRILELENHQVNNYIGNYDYFIEKKEEAELANSLTLSEDVESPNTDSDTKVDWKKQKEEQAKQRKLENDIKKTESRIQEIELELESIGASMALEEVYSNPGKLMEFHKIKEKLDNELVELYDYWDSLIS